MNKICLNGLGSEHPYRILAKVHLRLTQTCLNGLAAMTHPCRGCDPGSTPGWGVLIYIQIPASCRTRDV